jgi:hypothetical protein
MGRGFERRILPAMSWDGSASATGGNGDNTCIREGRFYRDCTRRRPAADTANGRTTAGVQQIMLQHVEGLVDHLGASSCSSAKPFLVSDQVAHCGKGQTHTARRECLMRGSGADRSVQACRVCDARQSLRCVRRLLQALIGDAQG